MVILVIIILHIIAKMRPLGGGGAHWGHLELLIGNWPVFNNSNLTLCMVILVIMIIHRIGKSFSALTSSLKCGKSGIKITFETTTFQILH